MFKALFGGNAAPSVAEMKSPLATAANLLGGVLPSRKVAVQTNAEIIEEIHNSFYNAGDKLLAEAKALLSMTSDFKLEKVNTLRMLGFANSSEVKEFAAQEGEMRKAKELTKLINSYAMKYPTQRFITRDMVDTIAEKYGLTVGGIDAFTGFVPNEKLKQIERFVENFHAKDMPTKKVKITKFCFPDNHSAHIRLLKKESPDLIFEADDSRIKTGINDPYIKVAGQNVWFDHYTEIDMGAMLIAAPKKDMDTSLMSEIKGHFFPSKAIVAPDPVVLQPVEGGFLVVAAWGEEASDPMVTNSINN